MIYNWYLIINRTAYRATGLVSKEFTLYLDGFGVTTILVTHGRRTSLLVNGVFLPVPKKLSAPFAFGGLAVYANANDDIFLGVPVA